MRKKLAKAASLLLAGVMVFAMTACGGTADGKKDQASQGGAQTTEGGDGRVSFSIAIMNGPKVEDTWIEHELEERFNCDIELIFLPGWDDLNTKVSMLMNDEDQRPDVMWWSGMNAEYEEWVEAGWLIDLVPLLQNIENSNILDYYDANTMFPTYKQGGIYSIPGDVAEKNCMTTIVRKDWLEKLNMEEPKTIDEFVAYLRACKTQDPDGNGQDDTYGYAGDSGNWRSFAPFFYSYKADPAYFVKLDDGTIVHGSTQPENREVLKLLAQLYQEGIFEPSIFTKSNGEELIANGKFGAMYRFLNVFSPTRQENMSFKQNFPDGEYIPVGPITGPDGFGSDEPESGWGWCSYGITDKCENPQRVMEIMDEIASGEIFVLDKWGKEGVHYELSEDGAAVFIADESQRNADGLSTFTGFVNRKDEYNLQNTAYVNELFAAGVEKAKPLSEYRVYFANSSREMWNMYGAELDKLRDEYFYGIITGEKPLEAFDEYVELFYANGGREVEQEANEFYKQQNDSYKEFEGLYAEWFQ